MSRRKFLGPAIRVIRERTGIRHGDFARRVGISAPYLTNIERGIRQPAPNVAQRIIDELGVTLDDVSYVTGEEPAA